MARQLRATVTRQGILEAAAHVFDAKGFDAATINDVVSLAGCTKGALYFHFESKEALAEAIIGQQQGWLKPGQAKDPVQRIIDTSYAFASALQDDVILRASIRLTVQTGTFDGRTAQAYRVWADAVAGHLKLAKAQDLLQDRGCSVAATAELIISAITGIQLTSEALTARSDLPRRMHVLWKLLIPSLIDPGHVSSLRLGPPRHRRSPTTQESSVPQDVGV